MECGKNIKKGGDHTKPPTLSIYFQIAPTLCVKSNWNAGGQTNSLRATNIIKKRTNKVKGITVRN